MQEPKRLIDYIIGSSTKPLSWVRGDKKRNLTSTYVRTIASSGEAMDTPVNETRWIYLEPP